MLKNRYADPVKAKTSNGVPGVGPRTIGGATEQSIQEQTGHKSVAVLRRYVREASLFRNNAAKKIGL